MKRAPFSEIESLIRTGNTARAASLIKTILLKNIRRSEYATYSKLARRAGLPRLGLRILNPIVRAERGSSLPAASDAEKVEYAASLTRIGIVTEALKILESVDADLVPESLLYHAFALFQHWRYADAIPLIEGYLKHPIDQYQRLIAQVNLAASLVYVRNTARATEILEQVIGVAREAGALRLLGNAYELLAQSFIRAERFSEARGALGEATKCLEGDKTFDQLFVIKWLAICDLKEGAPTSQAHIRLAEVRSEAIRRADWETVRDVDFHSAAVTSSSPPFLHVYFGTPFPKYRERMRAEAPPGIVIPPAYVWRLPRLTGSTPGDEDGLTVFDLFSGQEDSYAAGPELKPGALSIMLLRILASDFYSPFQLASLFARLFPFEYFNPVSSPRRVREIIRRLRSSLREAGSPIRVIQGAGTYRLAASQPCAIRITLENETLSPGESALAKLREEFGSQWFSSEMAALTLRISQRSARRLLTQGDVAAGVEKAGTFARTQYRLTGARSAA